VGFTGRKDKATRTLPANNHPKKKKGKLELRRGDVKESSRESKKKKKGATTRALYSHSEKMMRTENNQLQ